jgi:GLPGLI family protein
MIMKKHNLYKIQILFILFQIIHYSGFSQFFDHPCKVIDTTNLYVVYNLIWKQDTNDLQTVNSEEMILFIGREKSKFMSYNQYRFNEAGRIAEREGKLSAFLNEETIKSFNAKLTYQIYKNFPQESYTYTKRIMPTNFVYEEPLSIYQWEFCELTDTIGEFVAHCALTDYGGRKWVAWYTPEIPINEGPYKFKGLPGLIIKLHDELNHYVFELNRIERPEGTHLIEYEDKDWIKTDRVTFLQAESNFRHDIINRVKDAGGNSQTQQVAARSMMKRNNPIELE